MGLHHHRTAGGTTTTALLHSNITDRRRAKVTATILHDQSLPHNHPTATKVLHQVNMVVVINSRLHNNLRGHSTEANLLQQDTMVDLLFQP